MTTDTYFTPRLKLFTRRSHSTRFPFIRVSLTSAANGSILFGALLFACVLSAADEPIALNDLNRVLLSSLSKTVVSVRTEGMESGSGVIVGPDGLVLTANTLLSKDKRPVQIRFADGQTFSAEVVATDRNTESALLQIKTAGPPTFSYLPLADSSTVSVGSHAISAGNPLDSICADHQIALSLGTITATYNVCSCDAASCYCGIALETDAAINAGSEGGAFLNDVGQLIGMTCLAVERTRMKATAIPINRIKSAYATLLIDKVLKCESAANARQDNATATALSALVKIPVSGGAVRTVTGIAIDAAGHILTVGMFVEGQRLDVELASGESAHATVVRQSSALDVSLLQMDSRKATNWIALNEKMQVVSGIPITIVSKSAASVSINQNIVSAVGRLDGTAAQTDARLNESDAGGSVLNLEGELIGIVSRIDSLCKYGSQNAGVSFFTPARAIQSWLGNSVSTEPRCDDPLAKLVARSSDAFVFIGDGSGVLISEDGYALTNYHVAGSQDTWTVRLGGEQHTRLCDVVSRDSVRDLCVVKIRGIEHAPYLKLGSSAALENGQRVLALGDPFKLGEKSGGPAASLGIISALHRHQGRYADAIQTDCSINPGNSGGPLLNLSGELVGLNGQIISRYGKNNTGIAFAIPIDQIKLALPPAIMSLMTVSKR